MVLFPQEVFIGKRLFLRPPCPTSPGRVSGLRAWRSPPQRPSPPSTPAQVIFLPPEDSDLDLHTLLKTHRALPMLTTEGEITEGVRVSNEVHLHQIPMSKEIDLFGNKKKSLLKSFVPCLYKGDP